MAIERLASALPQPEVILLLVSLIAFLSIFCRINRTRARPVNWPVIGMMGGIAANADRILDYITAGFTDNCTFEFKGPWLSGMKFLITCDPANVNHILATHFDSYPKGEDFKVIFDVLGDGLFSCDDDMWRHQRRMAHARMSSHGYRASIARLTRAKVEAGLMPLCGAMERSGAAFDLQDVFKRFTFDITCRLVLGVDPLSLSPDLPAIPFADAMDDAEHILFLRHTVPMFWWKLKRAVGVGMERRMAAAWEEVDRFIARCIAEKREHLRGDGERGSDLLSLYLGQGTDELDHLDGNMKGYLLSDVFLRDTLVTLLGAGKDTTGAALGWFFYLLSTNPDAERKVVAELGRARSVYDAEEVEGLVYLHAALCETLRLYPPVPINRKTATTEDVLPSGHRVRPGTMVIYSVYSMGRMERVWGEDCREFRPERWIAGDGKVGHQPSYKFLAFNCGPRTCLGKSMAFTEMKLAAAALVYNFRVVAEEGQVVEPKLSIALSMKNGFMVKLVRRGNRMD